MDNELDLTLKLGLPNPTVETHLSLHSPTSDQGTNVIDGGHGNNNNGGRGDNDNNNDGGEISNLRRTLLGEDVVMDDDGSARNNVDVNIRVYNYIFRMFAGRPNTLNFNPFPMSPSPPPAPVTPPASDYVLIDVPARRAHRNNSLLMAHARDANANARWRRGCGGFCGGRIEGPRKCTNINCNVLTTPMWRKGPLGPKSLCNACGIKFRKEQDKKSKRN